MFRLRFTRHLNALWGVPPFWLFSMETVAEASFRGVVVSGIVMESNSRDEHLKMPKNVERI
jgi:hypothetical protein